MHQPGLKCLLSNPVVDGTEKRNGENTLFMLASSFQMDLRYVYEKSKGLTKQCVIDSVNVTIYMTLF